MRAKPPFPAIVAAALLFVAVPAAAQSEGPSLVYASLPDDGPETTGSLPDDAALPAPSAFEASVDQGSIALRAAAPTECLPAELTDIVAEIADRFGAVSVESTHRSRRHNARAGGAPHSLHLACRAIDFRVRAKSREVLAYLRSRPEVGGLKVYRNGIIHIDNGDRRSW